MIYIPFSFGSLLHDIIPCVDFIFRVVFKKVEWSTGKVEYVGICLGKKFYDVLTEFGLGTFVSLINDEHIIFSLEDCGVLIEFSSSELGSSEVLHRCKIYVMLTRVLPGNFFQNFKRFSHFTGAIGVPVKEFEYLMKVFEPSLIDHRTMSKNHCAMVAAFLYDLQGREGLAKSHLGIPKHGLSA